MYKTLMWPPLRLKASATTGHPALAEFLLIFILAFSSTAAFAEQLKDRNWIEARTANFNVRSVLSEKDTVALARTFEAFRAAAGIVVNAGSTEDTIPTTIYAVGETVDFKQLGIKQATEGIFKRGLRNNIILIRDASSLEKTTSIPHEYTHVLGSNRTNLLQPKWFNEGVAEHLSAIRVRRNALEIGSSTLRQRGHIRGARWIPIEHIIAATDYYDTWNQDERAMFYTEAWALMHYLLGRPNRKTSFTTDMKRYLRLVESGAQDTPAFEKAFGAKTGLLNGQVQRHLKRGKFNSFTFKIDALLPAFEATVVKLTREEAALGLAQIALGNGALENAKRWFESASANELTRPHAEAGLGDVLKFRGDFAAAELHFEQAVALAPGDPYCQLDLAEYWHYRAAKTENTGERKKFFKRARRHYAKAQNLDDTMPETYAMHGQTFLMQGNYKKAIKMLEKAEVLLPSALDVRLILAEAYAAANRKKDSARAARSVLIWNHADSDISKHARKILASVDSKAENKAARTTPKNNTKRVER